MKSETENNLEHVLIKCITACEYCITLCLQEDDVKMMTDCINTNRDCIDICVITARFLARSSPHTKHVMRECIEICRKSEQTCGSHPDAHCQKCAEKCRECYQACEQFMQVAA